MFFCQVFWFECRTQLQGLNRTDFNHREVQFYLVARFFDLRLQLGISLSLRQMVVLVCQDQQTYAEGKQNPCCIFHNFQKLNRWVQYWQRLSLLLIIISPSDFSWLISFWLHQITFIEDHLIIPSPASLIWFLNS